LSADLENKALSKFDPENKELTAVILTPKDLESRAKIPFAARYDIWRTQAVGLLRFFDFIAQVVVLR